MKPEKAPQQEVLAGMVERHLPYRREPILCVADQGAGIAIL
jgi:hypothetical protein